MVVSLLRPKLLVFPAYGSCCSHKIVAAQSGFILRDPICRFVKHSLSVPSKNFTRFTNVTAMCLLMGQKNMHSKGFLYAAKIFYRRRRPYPLPRRPPRGLPEIWWKSSPMLLVLGSCAVVLFAACFVRVERIPYSRRLHIALRHEVAKKWEEYEWGADTERRQKKILPSSDPIAIRVESIGRQIIHAMNRGLMLDKQYKINGHAYAGWDSFARDSSSPRIGNMGFEDEILCESAVQHCPKHVQKIIWKPFTKHLNGMNWEIYVHNSEVDNAEYLAGKIVFYRGLLDDLRSDAEIATVMGHEIGHAIARHGAEKMIWILAWFLNIVLSLGNVSEVRRWAKDMILKFMSRRMEAEADYIGLMLMASAGYDPRIAPAVYLHIGNDEDEVGFDSTHPSGVERAKLLKKAEVMEEALEIYREVKAGNGVRSFIL